MTPINGRLNITPSKLVSEQVTKDCCYAAKDNSSASDGAGGAPAAGQTILWLLGASLVVKRPQKRGRKAKGEINSKCKRKETFKKGGKKSPAAARNSFS